MNLDQAVHLVVEGEEQWLTPPSPCFWLTRKGPVYASRQMHADYLFKLLKSTPVGDGYGITWDEANIMRFGIPRGRADAKGMEGGGWAWDVMMGDELIPYKDQIQEWILNQPELQELDPIWDDVKESKNVIFTGEGFIDSTGFQHYHTRTKEELKKLWLEKGHDSTRWIDVANLIQQINPEWS